MWDESQLNKLRKLAEALIDQKRARVLIEPLKRSSGFWFGGGNVIRDGDGSFLICGRYRNHGDSRTGVGAGDRGLELAVFRSMSPTGGFEKILSFNKDDLACNGISVISIEGAALHHMGDGIELFISTEKNTPYPERIAGFQKPGTGVWSIDHIHSRSVENLNPSNIEEIIPYQRESVERLHCKDPWVSDLPNGDLLLGYCTHPFSWSSSGTAAKIRKAASHIYEDLTFDMLSRGPVWDIAAARITDRLAVPKLGVFRNLPDLSMYFYDSCECLRQLDENPSAVSRPRGWSCEEIGGVALGRDDELPLIKSISVENPLFVSPYGTGCSRYVSTVVTDRGIFANWQQSQPDFSQPLVGHFLPMDAIEEILSD